MPDTGEGLTHLRGQIGEATTAGEYTVRVQSDNGYWKQTQGMKTCTFEGECYSAKVAPVVTSVDESSSFVAGGNLITITGLGFSPKASMNTVSIDGVSCEVVEASAQ